MNSPTPPIDPCVPKKNFIRRVLGAMIDIRRLPFFFVLAAVMTFLIEALSRHSALAAARFLVGRPLAFLVNYGIILLTILPALLFRKRLAWTAFLSAIWLALGVTQCIVLYLRVSPLSFVDIILVSGVISIFKSYLSLFSMILIGVVIVAALVGLVLLFIRAKKYPSKWKCFLVSYPATAAGLALVVLWSFATGQVSDQFANLAKAHNDYGFPYCFTMSVIDRGVDRPKNYGPDLIDEIVSGLPDENTDTDTAERAPNVIIVQLESFFDVKYLSGVTYNRDPVPGFTALKEQYPSGLFTVPVIGAGTVNTEFEVLTGMSVAHFGAGEYPFRTVMRNKTCESIAYDLRESGYKTHALHNHRGTFYRRNSIYPNLGFDSFTSIEYFKDPTFNENEWAHDALLTDEILCLLNATEESDLVFAVSVQGHGKYPNDYTPLEGDVAITDGMDDAAQRSRFNYYISQISQMDDFVTELYNAVMAMEEDTVLVFYGDHMPNLVMEDDITMTVDPFETEYVIITNYDAPNPLSDRDMDAYHLFPVVMELIGNDTGIMNRFHQTYRDDPDFLEMLETLEYDALYGDRLAWDGMTYEPVDMDMGSRPIWISNVYVEGGYLYVTGENFTHYSTVTLDGKEKDTEYVDACTLRVRDKNAKRLLQNAQKVTIRQNADTGKTLSETSAYRIRTAAS